MPIKASAKIATPRQVQLFLMNRETKHDDLSPVLFNESKISFLRYSSETQFTSALLLLITDDSVFH
jgi:hypothetical protein